MPGLASEVSLCSYCPHESTPLTQDELGPIGDALHERVNDDETERRCPEGDAGVTERHIERLAFLPSLQ